MVYISTHTYGGGAIFYCNFYGNIYFCTCINTDDFFFNLYLDLYFYSYINTETYLIYNFYGIYIFSDILIGRLFLFISTGTYILIRESIFLFCYLYCSLYFYWCIDALTLFFCNSYPPQNHFMKPQNLFHLTYHLFCS